MKQRQSNLLAGLAALASLLVVLVVVGFVSRGAAGFGVAGGQTLRVQFESAPGVRAGTPVLVGGVPVGRVRDVRFAEPDSLTGGLLVELALSRGIQLRRGTAARAVAPALGGRAAVELLPGPADEPPLESGAPIHGQAASGLDALLPANLVWALERNVTRVGDAAAALSPVLSDMQRIVQPRSPSAVDMPGGPPGNLASVVARLDESLRRLNDLLGDDDARRRLHRALDDLGEASEQAAAALGDVRAIASAGRAGIGGFEQWLVRADTVLTDMDRRVGGSIDKLNRDLDLAADVLAHLAPAAAKIGRGEGTLGKLIHEDRLYEALMLSLRRASQPGP